MIVKIKLFVRLSLLVSLSAAPTITISGLVKLNLNFFGFDVKVWWIYLLFFPLPSSLMPEFPLAFLLLNANPAWTCYVFIIPTARVLLEPASPGCLAKCSLLANGSYKCIKRMQLAADSDYPGYILTPFCLQYKFNRSSILTYCTFLNQKRGRLSKIFCLLACVKRIHFLWEYNTGSSISMQHSMQECKLLISLLFLPFAMSKADFLKHNLRLCCVGQSHIDWGCFRAY